MAEMVASVVVQEAVGGTFSYLSSNREEKASERHNIERLELAHTRLEFALERSAKLPITDVSLLRQRRMFNRVYEECGGVVERCKLRVLEFDEQQGFELFADNACKFVRDVETGCTLWHRRFFSPLIRQLLEGKPLKYEMLQGSQTLGVTITPIYFEERGVEAFIFLDNKDSRMPLKNFDLNLILRLSESTDIVGTTISCLKLLLGPRFMPLAKFAVGQLVALQSSSQDVPSLPQHHELMGYQRPRPRITRDLRPDPFCCAEKRNGSPCADIISSKLPYDIPEPVIYVSSRSYISASTYLTQQTKPIELNGIVRDWPALMLTVHITPHSWYHEALQGSYELAGVNNKHIYASLHEMQEMVVPNAIDCFIRQTDLWLYKLCFRAAHGGASFGVEMSSIQLECTNSRSRARRASKRRRQ